MSSLGGEMASPPSPAGELPSPVFRGVATATIGALATFLLVVRAAWPWEEKVVWIVGIALLAGAVTVTTDHFLLKSSRTRFAANVPPAIVLALSCAAFLGPTPYLVGIAVVVGIVAGLLKHRV